MATIARIWAREILDSRGIPTIEAACQLDTGHIAVAAVPSGTSTGTYEALELRDGDDARYHGKGVLNAVNNINQIIGPSLIGLDPSAQEAIDMRMIEMDGSENKSKLGANAILAISEAVTKAGAMANQMSLYKWIMTLANYKGMKVQPKMPNLVSVVIEGGLHGAGNLDFQEFWIIPAMAKKYPQAIQMVSEIYHSIGKNLAQKGAIHSVGEEGAYAPNLFTNADALGVIVDTIQATQYQLGRDVFIGLDVAASEFFKNGGYVIKDSSTPMLEENMIEYYKNINQTYHMVALEDPLHEDAWSGWTKLSSEIGDQLMVIGDDLLVTNIKKLEKAISEKACNSILVKPNQVGSVTETINVVKRAKEAGWKTIISHRAGETNDWFIADFAVGVGADYVKFGAPARGERVAKYNRLLTIASEIQN